MATRKKAPAAATVAAPTINSVIKLAAHLEDVLGPEQAAHSLKNGGSSNDKGSKFDSIVTLNLEQYAAVADALDTSAFDIQVTIRGAMHREWQANSQGSIAPSMLAQLGLG